MTPKNCIFVFSLRYRAAFPCFCLHGVGTRATYIAGKIMIPGALCVVFYCRVKGQNMVYKRKTLLYLMELCFWDVFLHLSFEFEQQSGNAPSSVLLLNIMIYVSAVGLYCTARAPRARFTPAEQGPRGPPKVGSGTLPPALPGKATENFSIFGSFFRTGVGIE